MSTESNIRTAQETFESQRENLVEAMEEPRPWTRGNWVCIQLMKKWTVKHAWRAVAEDNTEDRKI